MKKVINKSLLLIVIALFSNTTNAQKNEEKLKAIQFHNKAVYLMEDIWMRDPYIELAPDGYYYLSCTRQNSNLKLEAPKGGIEVFKSRDLVSWESLGVIWNTSQSAWGQEMEKRAVSSENMHNIKEAMVWAPESHFINGKWVIVYTSNQGASNLMLSKGAELKEPFAEPFGQDFGKHHDPAIFMDGKTPWLIDKCAEITQLKEDFSGFIGEPVKIGPSNRKMGHEGCYIVKIKNKYVLFGTAWSTDTMRHGTYNLYYATADKVTGPYNERKFAGRFLGHGTPFKDKNGNWWCTAFYNASKPVLSGDDAKQMDLTDTAYTINKQGLTLVPIEFKIVNGDVKVIVKDANYATPGKEEVQKF
ncbi:family 43 glycosylhydrolase [Flavobacterium sp. ARAG 55.4]|uniref:family 43 glycosylhydrolase n=1 Tax=Flavobacterium sp. ARAG 55.4 TaxID=3451357 RepID=UPI003F448F4C